ncbi:MAG: hypothetical protein AAGA00_11295 [Pseudomonadota bacterium]
MLTQLIVARSALELDKPDLKAHAKVHCYTSRRLLQARGLMSKTVTSVLSRFV